MTIPQHCVDDTAALMNLIEKRADELVLLISRLPSELVKAQDEGRVHPVVMHRPIFAKLPKLLASAMELRGDAVDVHRGLNEIAQKFQLARSPAFMGPWDKDDDKVPPPPTGAAPVDAQASSPRTVVPMA